MLSSLNRIIARISAVFRAADFDRDLHAELGTHVELRAADLIRQGMQPEDAARRARIELGGIAQLREAHRESRGLPFVDTILQDLRYALRQFRNRPAFCAMAVAILGIGIGANAAIFSVVNTVLLHPLPFGEPERLVALFERDVIGDNNPYNAVACKFFGLAEASDDITTNCSDFDHFIQLIGNL